MEASAFCTAGTKSLRKTWARLKIEFSEVVIYILKSYRTWVIPLCIIQREEHRRLIYLRGAKSGRWRGEKGGGREEKDNKAMWMKARKSRLTLQSQKPESSRALARKNVKSFNCNVTFSFRSRNERNSVIATARNQTVSIVKYNIAGDKRGGEGERLSPRCVRAPTNWTIIIVSITSLRACAIWH